MGLLGTASLAALMIGKVLCILASVLLMSVMAKGNFFFIMFMLRSKGGDVLYLASPHIDGFWFLILSRDHTSPISMAQLLAAFLIHHNTLLSVITEKV